MTFFNQLMEAVSQVFSPDRMYHSACFANCLLFLFPAFPPAVLPVTLEPCQRPLVLPSHSSPQAVSPLPSTLVTFWCHCFLVFHVSASSTWMFSGTVILKSSEMSSTYLQTSVPSLGQCHLHPWSCLCRHLRFSLCPLLFSFPSHPHLNVLSLLWAWIGSSLIWLMIVNLLLVLVPLSSLKKNCSQTDSCIQYVYHHV